MTIRVLLLARELNLGGSERQMTEIARGLDRSRFEPHVGCFLPQGLRGAELSQAGVPVLHLPVHSLKSASALRGARQLIRYIRDNRIDIVHAFDYPMNVFALPVTRYLTRAIPVASQRGHRDLTPPFYLRLLRQTDRIAAGIVVNCEYLRRHLMEDYGIAGERLHLCYNGIDLDAFPRARTPHDGIAIGTVCALRPEKSIGTLLEAMALIRECGNLRLTIVGDGPERNGLQRQAASLGLERDVVFHPATAEVARLLHAMDIFVLPSRTEALSNALMEAMSCGCACIASNVGGNPELVDDQRTGLLFEPGNSGSLADALRRLIREPGLRSSLSDNAVDFMQRRFSLAVAARRMGAIYEQLLNRRT